MPPTPPPAKGRPRAAASKSWPLQDAKARFSELVRNAQSEGPQHVSIHGRDTVVVLSKEEYARLKGERSGKELVDLLAGSPLNDVEFEHAKIRGPVRDVKL